jgi:glyoxylase-like metal-dependent hydrolase (beta-lactamase superfamily II)
MKQLSAAAIAGSIAICTAASAQTPAPQGPLVREGTTVKISEHVHVIPDNSVPGVPNVGVIVGAKSILVVDTGMGRRNGETVVREARKAGGNKPLYLVTTHVHPEHDLGAQAFPADTKMIRSRAQVSEIAEFGQATADVFRKRSAINRELLEGAEFRKADITFDGEYSLDLGGLTVKIYAVGPNHTPGDTITYVAQDGVLFSGDVAMKPLPAFASPKSSLSHWLASLDKLEALKPRIVVPSHGPNGDASYIAAYRQYLTSVRDKTAAAKAAGKSVEEATQIVVGELQQQYPDTGRINGAVRTAYAEAK